MGVAPRVRRNISTNALGCRYPTSVPDVAAAVAQLQAAGVRFERYDGMSQDERGIWTAPSGARIAWLKDPDGNTLSLTQLS